MGTPPISILMACYNSEQFLQESLPCILNQTFQDFEVVVVDDGSTDGTLELLNEYAKHDKRIIILTKEHSGLTDSLQYGLNAAQGEWIARWDADDLADPKRLEQQFTYLQEHPDIVLIGSGCVEIDTLGKVIKKHIYPSDHETLVHNLRQLRKFFPHSSALFNRRKALSVGGYRQRFTYAQDRDLWLRLAEVGKIACLQAPLVYLRRHENTISYSHASFQVLLGLAATICHLRRVQGLSDPSFMDESVWQEFLRWLERHLFEEGMLSDEIVWREFRKSFYGLDNVRGSIKSLISLMRKPRTIFRVLTKRWLGSNIAFRLAREWSGG